MNRAAGRAQVPGAAQKGETHRRKAALDETKSVQGTAIQSRSERLMRLQGAIGNASVQRMLRAGSRARSESPVPIPPPTQRALDSRAGRGETLGGDLLGQMEDAVGGDLRGIRVHRDPVSDALARGFAANAFTQGQDIFMRVDRDPASEIGRATLAHELTHVVLGGIGRGAVLREPAVDQASPPNQTPTQPATVSRVDPVCTPEDGVPMADDKRYDLDLIFPAEYLHNAKEESYQRLPAPDALKILWRFDRALRDSLDLGRGLNEDLARNREEHDVVGFWSDVFGGVDLPDVDLWNEVGRGPLVVAESIFEESAEQLRQSEQRWMAESAGAARRGQEEAGTFVGDALDRVAAIPSDHVARIAYLLQDAADRLAVRWKEVITYKEGTEAGAERGITVCKVSIAVLSTAVGGEAFAMAKGAGYGLMASTAFSAGAGVVTTEAASVGEQIGEMRYGEREWFDFDFAKLAKDGLKSAIGGFIGGMVGGALGEVGELAGARFVAWAGPAFEELGVSLSGSGAKFVGGLFTSALGGALTAPFTTSANLLMNRLLGDPTGVKSFDDFFTLVLHDMKDSAEMAVFMHTAGEAVQGMQGSGPRDLSTGVPEPVGPEGDAYAESSLSSDVPASVGLGRDAYAEYGLSDAVPEPVGLEGDAYTDPDVSTGVPEPVGPEGDAYAEDNLSAGIPRPIDPVAEPMQPTVPEGSESQPEPARKTPGVSSGKPSLRMTPKALQEFCQRLLSRPVPRFGEDVHFHQTVEDFQAAWAEKWPGEPPPGGGGFFDPATGELHFAPGEGLLTAVHEVIHRLSSDTFPLTRQLVGPFLDEGITEWIARDRVGPEASDHAYDQNVAFAEFLAGRLGRAPVENAVLHGDYATLRASVKQAVGGSEAKAFEVFRLLSGMEAAGNPVAQARIEALLGGNAEITASFMASPEPAAANSEFMLIDDAPQMRDPGQGPAADQSSGVTATSELQIPPNETAAAQNAAAASPVDLDLRGLPGQIFRADVEPVGPAYATFEEAFANKLRDTSHITENIVTVNGQEVARWWEVSESLADRGIHDVGMLGHTEQKALTRVRLSPGTTLEIRGSLPPCTLGGGCDVAMQAVTSTTGGRIIYRTITGDPRQYPRTDF